MGNKRWHRKGKLANKDCLYKGLWGRLTILSFRKSLISFFDSQFHGLQNGGLVRDSFLLVKRSLSSLSRNRSCPHRSLIIMPNAILQGYESCISFGRQKSSTRAIFRQFLSRPVKGKTFYSQREGLLLWRAGLTFDSIKVNRPLPKKLAFTVFQLIS